MLSYGPEVAGTTLEPIALVGTYGELELEYAALRKGCLLLDLPHRAVLEVTGSERLEFLNRMLTQELKPGGKWLGPRACVNSFWLNRKGRIDADLRVLVLDGRVLLECDAFAADRTVSGLGAFIISEDATIRDLSSSMHRLSLHGPTASVLLDAVREDSGVPIESLVEHQNAEITLGGATVVVDRRDLAGVVGLDLFVPEAAARVVYELLLSRGFNHAHPHESGASSTLAGRVRLRPGGWHALNIARIEAGSPMYNVDFGPDALPAETGVLKDRVSFTKGCYLGQEVVARMHSRGHAKREIVTLRGVPARASTSESDADDPMHGIAQPVSGAPVYLPGPHNAPAGEPVGTVTSSTVAPMLGAAVVCFASIKHDALDRPDFLVAAEGGLIPMMRSQTLRTFPPA